MALYRLRSELLVNKPIAEVFPFFEDARNLSKLTPPWVKFEMLTHGEIVMKPGAEIAYNIRLLGIPLYWKSIITEYHPPHRFVDEQAKGPYAYWRHTHSFREVPEGTVVGDDVDYSLPLGVLGQIGHPVVVWPQLIAIFRYRHAAMGKLFSGQTEPLIPPVIVRA